MNLSTEELVEKIYLEYEKIVSRGKRTDLENIPVQVSSIVVGEKFNLSPRSVNRYLRLHDLTRDLLHLVSIQELAIRTGVELSYLPKKIQDIVYYEYLRGCHITFTKAKVLRALCKGSILNKAIIHKVCTEDLDSCLRVTSDELIVKHELYHLTRVELFQLLDEALDRIEIPKATVSW